MTNPKMTIMVLIMITILMMNMMTTKTSIMCLNLIMYTMMMTITASMKMKLTPIPFIVFLTIIGGLMIIFMYLAATMWMKKEKLTLKTKMMALSMLAIPPMFSTKHINLTLTENSINMFNNNLNNITMMLILLLTLMLVFTIEIHLKANLPFRRKLKIWE